MNINLANMSNEQLAVMVSAAVLSVLQEDGFINVEIVGAIAVINVGKVSQEITGADLDVTVTKDAPVE